MFRHLLAASLALALFGCATPPAPSVHTTNPSSSTLQGDPTRPAQAQWLRTELYFALGQEDGKEKISEQRWRQFLELLAGSAAALEGRDLPRGERPQGTLRVPAPLALVARAEPDAHRGAVALGSRAGVRSLRGHGQPTSPAIGWHVQSQRTGWSSEPEWQLGHPRIQSPDASSTAGFTGLTSSKPTTTAPRRATTAR